MQDDTATRVFTEALASDTPTVVTLSPGAVTPFLRVADRQLTRRGETDRERPKASVVLPTNADVELSRPEKVLVAELVETNELAIRLGAVTNTVCSTPEATTAVDPLPQGAVVVSDDAVPHELYRDVFEQAQPANVSLPSRREVSKTIQETVIPRAAGIVERQLERAVARGENLDPACLCLWAGAAVEASAPAVVDTVIDTGVACRRHVEEQLTRLCEDDCLLKMTVRPTNSGEPARRLTVAADVGTPTRPPDWVRVSLAF